MSIFRRLTEVSRPSRNVGVPSHRRGTQMNKSPHRNLSLFPNCRDGVTSCLIVIHCHCHIAHREPKSIHPSLGCFKSYSIMAMRKVAYTVTL